MTEESGGPATNGTATTNHTRFCAHSSGLDRRLDAAARCNPLNCGCRDPWTCRCDEPDPTPRHTEAAILAAEHLLRHGLTPLFSMEQGRALWRAGHRDLAVMTVQVVA